MRRLRPGRGARRGDRPRLRPGPLLDRYATPLPARGQFADGIERLLRQKGAPPLCHVMSADRSLDNREVPLSETLEEIVGRGAGAVLSCIPGRLAYFEGEEPGDRYILERP